MNHHLPRNRHIHFIGIGGIGMSAIALILLNKGYSISGSDISSSNRLMELKAIGITIFPKQLAENLESLQSQQYSKNPLIIISTAINARNQELLAAKELKLEIWHRSDLLAALINTHKSIAVAGTHGKTTTSTILTTLLALLNQDPTAVIGGIVPYYNSNGHSGKGHLLVAEADESDGSLVKFTPEVGIITNLELDHIDHYANIEDLIKTIQIFCTKCKSVIANYDCPVLKENIEANAWWSIKDHEAADFAAIPIKADGAQTIADIYEQNRLIGKITLPMPGLHNLNNAMAAIAACRLEGIPFDLIQTKLQYLKMPGRRFDYRGIWQGRHIIDDYAHHPSEIKATIEMGKLMINSKETPLRTPPKRLVIVFQPHRFSRTRIFEKEFANSLGKCDLIILAPIYAAGELPITNINSESIADCIRRKFPSSSIFVGSSLDGVTELIKNKTKKDDLVVIMGAGDINNIWEKLNHQSNEAKCQKKSIAA